MNQEQQNPFHALKHIQKNKTKLQRLALDKQNVHTTTVVNQTTEIEKYLADIVVPSTQDTLKEIESAWKPKGKRKVERVLTDMREFYTLEINPHYRNLLDCLWRKIQTHTEKAELIQRLWEECSEAVRKCYQGHISRLCNVMVGFTDEVKPVVPLGELLQQKIAAIAGKDMSVEYKVGEAWSVFEELKVPMEERDAWIEAF